MASIWFRKAIDVAVLVSTLTALVWYILAMGCLFVLRRREPQLFRMYRAPLYRVLPATVVALAASSRRRLASVTAMPAPPSIARASSVADRSAV